MYGLLVASSVFNLSVWGFILLGFVAYGAFKALALLVETSYPVLLRDWKRKLAKYDGYIRQLEEEGRVDFAEEDAAKHSWCSRDELAEVLQHVRGRILEEKPVAWWQRES